MIDTKALIDGAQILIGTSAIYGDLSAEATQARIAFDIQVGGPNGVHALATEIDRLRGVLKEVLRVSCINFEGKPNEIAGAYKAARAALAEGNGQEGGV